MALTQVKSDGIATGAVTATQIAANAVTVDDISDGSISTAKLADDAVTADKLADTAVAAGTYGSSSAIPSITVDAQGRITSASTSSIDSTAITNGTSNVSVAASGDITATRAGTQRLAVTSTGIDVTGTVNCDGLSVGGGATFDNGTSTTVNIVCDDGGVAELSAHGSSQGTGALFAGQTTGFGGGIFYNGDGTPAYATGEEQDRISFFRRDNTTNNVVFSYGYSSNDVEFRGNIYPSANNTYDLGTSSLRWRNVYTNDLNLSNEGGANDVDGTWGSWTIQEGEDDLFLLNRRNGKKYKFNLSEVN